MSVICVKHLVFQSGFCSFVSAATNQLKFFLIYRINREATDSNSDNPLRENPNHLTMNLTTKDKEEQGLSKEDKTQHNGNCSAQLCPPAIRAPQLQY